MIIGRVWDIVRQRIAGRTEVFDWAAYGDNNQPLALEAGDVVLFKLCATQGGTPVLDLTSDEATENESIVLIDDLGDEEDGEPARGRVILAQEDTTDLATTVPVKYFGELLLVDSGETYPDDACKPIMRGQIEFVPGQGGNLGP